MEISEVGDRRMDLILSELKKIQEILKGDDYLNDGGVMQRVSDVESGLAKLERYKDNVRMYIAVVSVPSLIGCLTLMDFVVKWFK